MENLDQAYFPTKTIVPSTEIVHDRSNLEVFRGCIRGCRFCQAGFSCRPVRKKSPEVLYRQAVESLRDSGNHELTLASLSTSDYRGLKELTDALLPYCLEQKVNLSVPSLRADNFSRELMEKLQTVRKSGLTFAPEAGTQRLRDVINKNLTEEEILDTCARAFSGGWDHVKLYFMLGLPTETDEDVLGIAKLVYRVIQTWQKHASNKKRGLRVHVATAYFVPKPFTPFQWERQISPEEYLRRTRLLKDAMRSKCVVYNWHAPDVSRLEAVLPEATGVWVPSFAWAVDHGAHLDGWDEYFQSKSGWMPFRLVVWIQTSIRFGGYGEEVAFALAEPICWGRQRFSTAGTPAGLPGAGDAGLPPRLRRLRSEPLAGGGDVRCLEFGLKKWEMPFGFPIWISCGCFKEPSGAEGF